MRATLLAFAAVFVLDAQPDPRWDDSRLRPFVLDHRNAAGALVDLSDTLDKPVQPLDGSGQALGAPIAASRSGNGWRLVLGSEGAAPTTWYKLEVKR